MIVVIVGISYGDNNPKRKLLPEEDDKKGKYVSVLRLILLKTECIMFLLFYFGSKRCAIIRYSYKRNTSLIHLISLML